MSGQPDMWSAEPTRRVPVLIVGAGPAGLSAALGLRAAGLPAIVLDKRGAESVRPGSRAAYLHGESLRHLEQVSPGLGWEVAGNGLMWHTKRSFWCGKEVFTRTYSGIGRPGELPPFTSLPQVRTEDLMAGACKRAGVRFEWDCEITSAEYDSDGVRLRDSTGRTWEADYVIAADGSRSVLRSAIGRPLEGPRSQNTFVVVDLDDDSSAPLPLERVFHYRHPAVDGRNVLIVPFAGGWRVDLNLRLGDEPGRFSSPEGLRSWIAKVMPAAYGDRVRWVSTYRFAQQTAQGLTDVHRRVLLTGEAAHLFAPFGARGMNSSIPDALHAAEAVRVAIESGGGEKARAAVDLFAKERLAAAHYNRACAAEALDHMLAHRPAVWLRRKAAAALAAAGQRAGAWLDSAPYGPKAASKLRPGTSY
jgi:3-(3-hydroxy-phenyl)propionate hydroxylase